VLTLAAADIETHPRFVETLRLQASALLAIQAADPRTAGIFATQQRWLLAHLALAMYFERAVSIQPDGLLASHFLASAAAHEVASRNTADAFLKEMIKYGYVTRSPGGRDRRSRPLAVGSVALRAIEGWTRVHLASLDRLDGADRSGRFEACPGLIERIHPRIARGLLESAAVREPAPTFSLFTWLNEGGVVMDWLYAGLADFTPDAKRVSTAVAAFADFSDRIRLSRSHLARKLRAAEDLGSLGWSGERGGSPMWVSMSFVREYHAQQAAKLAIIDGAFWRVVDDRDGGA
jgi:DNA-binding MarR family transcriptional regulator